MVLSSSLTQPIATSLQRDRIATAERERAGRRSRAVLRRPWRRTGLVPIRQVGCSGA
jgi:hypothetical protein